PPGFERGVVRGPVGGLVARLGALGYGHATRLPARGARFVQQSHISRETSLDHFQKFGKKYNTFHGRSCWWQKR
ncbi:MAG: hypothetical protein ACI83N_002545, partial [Hydrogenophaga sp.]